MINIFKNPDDDEVDDVVDDDEVDEDVVKDDDVGDVDNVGDDDIKWLEQLNPLIGKIGLI